MYNFLNFRFDSPTINCFFQPDDFNKFCMDVSRYLNEELIFEKTILAYQTNIKHDYPVGRIGDILIYFNHFDHFDEAYEKWETRKKRINSNVCVIQSSNDINDARDFLNIPFEKKLCFVPKNINLENTNIIKTDYVMNDKMTIGEYVNHIATGKYPYIRLLDFLCGENYRRTTLI